MYQQKLDVSIKSLLDQITEYLPESINSATSFMFIFKKVVQDYEDKIISSFDKISNLFYQSKNKFLRLQIGFKPYSLLTESGSRISYENFHKTNYVKDPEIKYLKKTGKNRFSLLSITQKIDDIFNFIFQKVNEVIGNKTFMKFFLRRTLAGCEFGICLFVHFQGKGINDPNCLIDQDPLIVFTINVKSIIPVLAGILIMVLVYVASMSKKIAEWFANFPSKFTKEVALRVVGVILNTVAKESVSFGLDKVIIFLEKVLQKQIDKLKDLNHKQANLVVAVIENLMSILNSPIGSKITQKFSSSIGAKIKATLKWQKLIKNCFDPERLLKISIYIILCIASFLFIFNSHKQRLGENKISLKYEKTLENQQDGDQIIHVLYKEEKQILLERGQLELKKINDNYEDEEKDKNQHIIEQKMKNDEKEREKIRKFSLEITKTYLYQFKAFDPIQKIIDFYDFVEDSKSSINAISNGICEIKNCVQSNIMNKKCIRMCYKGLRHAFIQQIRIYETNKFPSIMPIIGYSIRRKKQYLFVQSKENGSLENIISYSHLKINDTQKLIIAYGIAAAIKYLHHHRIIHRNINPLNIYLDSKFYPYLSEFYYAKQIDVKYPYVLIDSTPGFMAPEFIEDYKSN